jgi:hypothetical protein
MSSYFIYSRHASQDQAEKSLAAYLADGLVIASAHPYIDQNLRAPKGQRYRVMFPR